MATRHYYLVDEYNDEAKYLGSSTTHLQLVKGCHGVQLESYAYGCPECGSIWARLAAQNERGQILPWAFRAYPCPRHGKTEHWRIPGILFFFLVPFEEMPEAALHRDVELILDHVERHGLENVFI